MDHCGRNTPVICLLFSVVFWIYVLFKITFCILERSKMLHAAEIISKLIFTTLKLLYNVSEVTGVIRLMFIHTAGRVYRETRHGTRPR